MRPEPLVADEVASLARFVEAGIFDATCVQVAALIARTVPGVTAEVLLGAALATRAPGLGHVCVEIEKVAGSIVLDDPQAVAGALDWPDPDDWARSLATSPAVAGPGPQAGETTLPLVWDGTRLYLERYWRFEDKVATDLLRRAAAEDGIAGASLDPDRVLGALFDRVGASSEPLQQRAAATALSRRLAVIAGGPGTGKTVTISRLLAAAHTIALERGRRLNVSLAAPTGKAAARMQAAVHEMAASSGLPAEVAEAMASCEAKTLHRLLGARGDGRTSYDSSRRLAHDLVVVDETSMVSLPLMARLLDAVRPDATLVLVGDPFQLASVEAGAVLGDIVGPLAFGPAGGPLASNIVVLEHNHRFGPDSQLADLAGAVRRGEDDAVVELLRGGRPGEVSWVDDHDDAAVSMLQERAGRYAVGIVRAAQAGDAESGLALAGVLKVICATRSGAPGVAGWSAAIEAFVRRQLPGAGVGGRRYVGRPVIVTRNDYFNNLFNGDVGLVMAAARGAVAVFRDANGTSRELPMSQLGEVDTFWATTIHKSQGSEFDEVIVSLPRAPSPILTRELLYTAVTRARRQVTVVASEEALRQALRQPVARASGLGARLWS